MTQAGKMINKRILFPLGERELLATQDRLLHCPPRVARYGYQVDVMTYKPEILEKAKERYKNIKGINIILVEPEFRFWTMQQRDSFAKTFIRFYHDIVISGTDFRFWKQVGFDDFLWNVSGNIYPKITEKYDLVVFPIPSEEEPPPNMCDSFYTNIFFYAKENSIPILGLQIYPIYDTPEIFLKTIDYFMVKDQIEKEFYQSLGVPEERLFLIEEIKDSYNITTVEDPYQQLIYQLEVPLDEEALGIAVINHPRYRSQIHEVINAIAETEIRKSVFFVFREYTVRDMTEEEIFDVLTKPLLDKGIKQYYKVDPGGLIKAMIHCDVMIAVHYMLPLSFASRYKKTGIVYNPLIKKIDQIKDVIVVNSKRALQTTLIELYERKKKRKNFGNIIRRIVK
jgi:hypothetical protein